MIPPGLLDRFPSYAQPIGPVASLGNAGGFSGAKLWRYASPRGVLLVRRWPDPGPGKALIEQIQKWVGCAGDLGFVPLPIPTKTGMTLVELDGHLFELTPWMPGQAERHRPPSLSRVKSMFRGLAAFHQRLARERTEGFSPGLVDRANELERLRLGEFDRLRQVVDLVGASVSARLALDWLKLAERAANNLLVELRRQGSLRFSIQPTLRDARPDHFLFEGDQLTGLVDFGAMGRETVAADLARLLAEALGADRAARSVALQAYESIRPLRVEEARVIPVFERANALLSPARWVRWWLVEPRTFDDPHAIEKGLTRGLERWHETVWS